MGRRAIRFTAIILMALMVAGGLPDAAGLLAPERSLLVYGASEIERISGGSAMQGENVNISYQITNTGSDAVTCNKVKMEFEDGDDEGLQYESDGVGVTQTGGKISVIFSVGVSNNADTGDRYYDIVLYDNNVEKKRYESQILTISEKKATPSKNSGTTIAASDITHQISPDTGFTPGNDNKISFEVFNRGNVMIRDAQLSLTLPEGMAIYNGSNTVNLGYIGAGSRKSTTVNIFVEDEAKSGQYQVTAKLSGFNYTNGEGTVQEKTFYIPVNGKETKTAEVSDLRIENIKVPGEVAGITPFTLTFDVKNGGKNEAKDIQVSLELPEGLMNRTVSTFVENTLAPGAVRSYSVSLFAADEAEKKNYPIKIVAKSLEEEGGQIAQFAGVYVKPKEDEEDGKTKTPQLMVAGYGYGGSNVQAGTDFLLSLDLLNTYHKKITNVKVTVSNADGDIVPKGSSSFFADSIPSKATYSASLPFSVKAQAEQKTSAVTVAMSYEDGEGNAFTSEDTISVPITQDTRLVVDDIVPPMEVYVGQMGSAEVQFYNMGKNTINNLRVNADGNFDVMESNSYFVGNMESGRSDSYSFTFMPREVGPVEGTITFTYEDTVGAQQFLEVPFLFEAMEMPVWDEGLDMEGEETEKKVPWIPIAVGGGILLLIIALIVWRKIRKARLHKALEIEDANWEKELDMGESAPPSDEGEEKIQIKKTEG